jgi:DNA-binding IclR family transcriptional regulator
VDRIRGEFLEMRGVSLTERETARLMGVSHAACFRILRGLVAEGSLRQTSEGRYMVADVLP